MFSKFGVSYEYWSEWRAFTDDHPDNIFLEWDWFGWFSTRTVCVVMPHLTRYHGNMKKKIENRNPTCDVSWKSLGRKYSLNWKIVCERLADSPETYFHWTENNDYSRFQQKLGELDFARLSTLYLSTKSLVETIM